MAFNSHTNEGTSFHPAAALSRMASATAAKAGKFVHALQTARMVSVLTNMSDQQLKQIGITRSEIGQYAQKLTAK
ncbi:DUF1127 domain-containing protein [Sulfitobacter sp. HNIBRBA2951]|uniref:DUF1127 domain-containing protein n=1 Tax=Sulfitobacter aquimarinus TaxID=3158557 RepID=UPI0032DFC7AE